MNDLHAQAPARQVRRGVAVVLLALLAPPGTLVLLTMVPALDLVLRSAVGHLVVVSAISACALAVAVADVWDALTSDRAYRPAWPPDRALAHLAADRGAHFDPRCLDAFLALMAERGHRPAGRHGDPAPAEESCHPTQPPAEASRIP